MKSKIKEEPENKSEPKIESEAKLVDVVSKQRGADQKIEIRRFTTINPSISLSTASTSKQGTLTNPNHSTDEIEEYMEFSEITNIDEINLGDDLNMDGLLEKSEFQILAKDSEDKFHIVETSQLESTGSGRKKYDPNVNDASNSSFQYELSESAHSGDEDGKKEFSCRHCGKQYRWKSTLRRHETVECGGKAPSYSCPYCDYKAKQRGNLGVHVRKHHPELPELPSRRKSNRNK